VTILLPVVLMLARTVADVALPEDSGLRGYAEFVGEPIVALLLALLLAMWTFGFRRGLSGGEVSSLAASGLVPAASIFVIIGAGGGFTQVLVESGVGDSPARAATATGVFFSHVTDAGSWLVRDYFGMSVRDTFRTWSVMETIVSVVGLLVVLVASLVV